MSLKFLFEQLSGVPIPLSSVAVNGHVSKAPNETAGIAGLAKQQIVSEHQRLVYFKIQYHYIKY